MFSIILVSLSTPSLPSTEDTLSSSEKSLLQLQRLIGSNQPINFTFNSLTLDKFLKLFGEEYNLNILNLAIGVNKPIQSSLLTVSPTQVFNTLIHSWGCSWYIQNNILYVVKQLPTHIFYLQYADAAEALPSLSSFNQLSSLKVHKNKNAIIAQGYPDGLRQVALLLSKLDTPPIQVLIEAKIVETNHDNQELIGLGIQGVNTSGSQTDIYQSNDYNLTHQSSSLPGFFVKTTRSGFTANLDATIDRIKGNVLAKPSLRVTNHHTAVIVTGQRLGFSTLSQGNNSTIEQIQFLDTGIKLNFTPHISENGTILMNIIPEVSEGQILDNKPRETTTKAETQVLVQDGETIVIGGLTRKKESTIHRGVPFFSDIPLLNLVFKKTETIEETKEIMIFITSNIIYPEKKELSSSITSLIEPQQQTLGFHASQPPLIQDTQTTNNTQITVPPQYAIEILNGSKSPNAEQKVSQALKTQQFNITKEGIAGHTNYEQTMIVDWNNNIEKAKQLAEALNLDSSRIISKSSHNKPLDFTIVLGTDWDNLLHQRGEG